MTAAAVVGQVDLGDHVWWTCDAEAGGLGAVGRVAATGPHRDAVGLPA
ncbi:hypothetical protein [Micromonospora deserti]|nr:hypothetical protein [Micromonospora deserti]